MPVKLPDFENLRYAGVRACGDLVLPEGALSENPAAGKRGFVTLYESTVGPAWAYFRIGNKHFHLEAVLSRIFKPPDRERVEQAQLEEMTSTAVGYEIGDVEVTAWYEFPISDLNPSGPIRTLNIGTQSKDLTMKITSATMELTGAVDLEVFWRVHRSNEKVLIAVTTTVEKFVIAENYLEAIAEEVDPYVDPFVTGRVTNDVA